MSYTGPKVRISRRLGIALTPRAQRVMERKPHPPGEHGQKRQRKTSIYEQQLREKQRLRFQYNISERQLVTHGHIQVNGASVDRPSYSLRAGDVLAVRPASRGIPGVAAARRRSCARSHW